MILKYNLIKDTSINRSGVTLTRVYSYVCQPMLSLTYYLNVYLVSVMINYIAGYRRVLLCSLFGMLQLAGVSNIMHGNLNLDVVFITQYGSTVYIGIAISFLFVLYRGEY